MPAPTLGGLERQSEIAPQSPPPHCRPRFAVWCRRFQFRENDFPWSKCDPAHGRATFRRFLPHSKFPILNSSRVIRRVARLPLDVAANAGGLDGRTRLARQNGLQRGPQIPARHRRALARTAVVKLAAVGQLALFVKQKYIRRAGRPEGLGRLLRLVKQIGKSVAGGSPPPASFFAGGPRGAGPGRWH